MITTEPEVIEIKKAEYLEDYKIELFFNDRTFQVVDFEEFLFKANNPMTTKYRDKKLFGKFKIEYGDLIWGDYEMCFPIADLYNGKI